MRSVTILTTCFGRMHFLRQVFPTWKQYLGWDVICATNAACPDHTPQEAQALGMRVVLSPLPLRNGRTVFHKTGLLNAAAREATSEVLLLLDADTMVLPGAQEELQHVPAGKFAFCTAPQGKRDLTGVLWVEREHWARVGGMDERFLGWGAEDLDLRLRLHVASIEFKRMDSSVFQPLAHSDDLRTRYSLTNSKDESLDMNNRRLAWGYHQRTGRWLHEDVPDSEPLQQLLGLYDEVRQRRVRLARPTSGDVTRDPRDPLA